MAYPNYLQNIPNYQFQQQQQPVIQNGGFISVPSEEIVKTYPVAPGNCVTFKIEGQPIVLEKSMGFSQFEAPRIERYRLVKEDVSVQEPKSEPQAPHIDDTALSELKGEIKALWGEIDSIKATKKPAAKKKEAADDDPE